MYYYEALVASNRYHSNKPLVFHSADQLIKPNTIVVLPLRGKTVLGLIKKRVSAPDFTTLPIEQIVDKKPLPAPLLKLAGWLREYYPANEASILSLLLPNSLKAARTSSNLTPPADAAAPASVKLPRLTKEQEEALGQIKTSRSQSVLLHGDTASGKTRVYLELVRQCFSQNKSALLLTPEIGLTPQLEQTFCQTFKHNVVVFHSTLTDKQRCEIWLRTLRSPEPLVVIGPRSALFMPLDNIGAIIMDEAHDNAYKQDQPPHYLAARVAAMLAKYHRGKFIMGTATPNIADYYHFLSKKLSIIRMKRPAAGKHAFEHSLVAFQERKNFSRSQHLSDQLLRGIEQALGSGEQSMVFLNRRGTARITLCKNCGWHAACPKCDTSLVYHGDIHQLQCHTCGYNNTPFTCCPDCKSENILLKGLGTKLLETELKKIFRGAKVARFDSDNPKSQQIAALYKEVEKGAIDILVGTQVLAKGLDLPNLSFVGVAAADSGLYLPDYTSEEQTFQQLVQVLGRVGRGHKKSQVVIQTYNTNGPALKAALKQNYLDFYNQQIDQRAKFNYPPFCHLLKIYCSRKKSSSARQACQKLVEDLRSLNLAIEILGPSPAFRKKANDMYRWQIVIKSKNRKNLTQIISGLSPGFRYDIDPVNLL